MYVGTINTKHQQSFILIDVRVKLVSQEGEFYFSSLMNLVVVEMDEEDSGTLISRVEPGPYYLNACSFTFCSHVGVAGKHTMVSIGRTE